jgi:hypothetical protein
MAATNYTPIQLYCSSTATNTPLAANLAAGELAINTADGKLYFKNSSGTVTLLASAAGASGDVVGPASATDNALARFDLTTGKLIQNSVGILSDAGALSGITDISASGSITLSGGTANGVAYLNGSKVLTTGSALVFDGANLGIGTPSPSTYAGASGQLVVYGGVTTTFTNNPSNVTLVNNGTIAAGLGAGINFSMNFNGSIATTYGAISCIRENATSGSENGALVFGTRVSGGGVNMEKMRLDSSGNLGLGVTPSTSWLTSFSNRVMQFGPVGSINSLSASTTNNQTFLSTNVIDQGGNTYSRIYADWITRYAHISGTHVWQTSTTQTGAVSLSNLMTLDTSGRLLVGTTTSPSSSDIKNVLSGAGGSFSQYSLAGGAGGVVGTTAASTLSFFTYTGNIGSETYTERARIDSRGNMSVGGFSPPVWNSGYKFINFTDLTGGFAGGSSYAVQIGANSYLNTSAVWVYGGASYGACRYELFDGSHYWFRGTSTPVAGSAVNFTTSMFLSNSGRLSLGNTDSTSAKLNVTVDGVVITGNTTGATMGANAIVQLNNSNSITNSTVMLLGGGTGGIPGQISSGFGFTRENSDVHWGTQIRFYTHPPDTVALSTLNEAMRIDSSGNLLVGRTTTANTTVGSGLYSYGLIASSQSASTNANTSYDLYSTGAAAYRFYVGMGGTIFATSIVISAISDERLKENVRDIDTGLDAIMALKPRRFDWKEGKGQDKKDVAGFIAQEFENVFPECVSTSKAGGDGIEYKNINHETLIPTLVKAMQEQQALITQLTARITALEGA